MRMTKKPIKCAHALRAGISSIVVLLAAAFILLANLQTGFSDLTSENVESMTWTAEYGDKKPTAAIDEEEWSYVLNLINTARRSGILKEYQPTYGEMYTIYNTLAISLKEQGAVKAKTYSLLLYNHKDWDIVHGEYDYKLALACTSQNGKAQIWGLPYDACYQMREWFWQKSDQN